MSPLPWNDRPSRAFILWGLSFLFHLCLMLTIGVLWNPRSQAPAQTDDRVIGVTFRHSLPQRQEPPLETDQLDTEQSEQQTTAKTGSAQTSAGAQSTSLANLGPASDFAVIDLDAALNQMLEGDAPSSISGEMSQVSSTSSEATIGDPNKRVKLDGEPGPPAYSVCPVSAIALCMWWIVQTV